MAQGNGMSPAATTNDSGPILLEDDVSNPLYRQALELPSSQTAGGCGRRVKSDLVGIRSANGRAASFSTPGGYGDFATLRFYLRPDEPLYESGLVCYDLALAEPHPRYLGYRVSYVALI